MTSDSRIIISGRVGNTQTKKKHFLQTRRPKTSKNVIFKTRDVKSIEIFMLGILSKKAHSPYQFILKFPTQGMKNIPNSNKHEPKSF